MESLFFAGVGLILLAVIALMLWRIEQRLRPETYVLMQRDDKTNEMVFADAFKEEYGTIAMAHAAAAALYLEDNDPVFIVSTRHRYTVDGVPTPPDPDSELLVCDQCHTEHLKRDFRLTAPELGSLYGKLVCASCLRAEAKVQSG